MAEIAALFPMASLPDLGPTTVDPTLGAGDVAFAVMRKQFRSLTRHEPGVRYDNDPEDLHQMRVAIRRLRAALVVFEEALPARAPRLRRELGWLGSLSGVVRDLDVQLAQIGAWSAEADPPEREALDIVTAVLDQRRTKSRARLVTAMDSRRHVHLTASMQRFLTRACADTRSGPRSGRARVSKGRRDRRSHRQAIASPSTPRTPYPRETAPLYGRVPQTHL